MDSAGARNHDYDAARAIESHLGSNEYGDLRYRSTCAPAALTRWPTFSSTCAPATANTSRPRWPSCCARQGVPARVVNGFQRGEYNDAADAYIVRQARRAFVGRGLFPGDRRVGEPSTRRPKRAARGGDEAAGWRAPVRKYAEALELFWIQYVVAYDKQEQRSLARQYADSLGIVPPRRRVRSPTNCAPNCARGGAH